MTDKQTILEVQQLQIDHIQANHHHTLEVSFSIRQGEALALVGESGSGKSLTANAILGLFPHSIQAVKGKILYQGEDMLPWPETKKRKLRGQGVGYVFQDYQGSFSPYIKIGKQLVEQIRTHRTLSFQDAKSIALHWLEQVDLPAERVFNSYSFQLSGGQCQRAAIAAVMMLEPTLLIADEPTTALDVLSGEVVLDLLTHLQKQHHCAVLFISHDLRHVLTRADTVAVMQEGRIVEMESARTIAQQPSHPYTRQLLQARPLLPEILTERMKEKAQDSLSVVTQVGGGYV